MKKQELQQIYDLCIDEWARYTLAGVQVSPELLSITKKLEEDMRIKDILEAMDRIKKSGPNIDLRSILDNKSLKPLPQNYVYLGYNKELYYDLLKANTSAAEFKQSMGANSTYHIQQQVRDYFDKITCPSAAEVDENIATQYKK